MKKFFIVFVILLIIFGGAAAIVYFTFKDKCKEIVLEQEFKTEYYSFEQLDLTGGKIKVISYSGDEEIIDITEDMIYNFNTRYTGNFIMLLKYEGKLLEIKYTVENFEVLEIISITGLKDVYNYKEGLQTDNVKIKYRTEDGVQEDNIPLSKLSVFWFDTESVGKKQMDILYGGADYEFDYEVKPIKAIKSVTGFESTYYKGIPMFVDAVAECENYDGTISMIEVTSSMVEGFDATTIGPRTATITITGVTYEVEYEVMENKINEIVRVNNLTTNYEKNGTLNLSGASMECLFENGQRTVIPLHESMITGFNTSIAGEGKSMTITFEKASINVNYNVYDIPDLVEGGLYYHQVNKPEGKYLYIYVDNHSSSNYTDFNFILSDVAPSNMIKENHLENKGTSRRGMRTIEDGYIKYVFPDGFLDDPTPNVTYFIKVTNGSGGLNYGYSSNSTTALSHMDRVTG